MPTVVLVGRPNTGKSTLFNRLVGGRVAITLAEPGITRDRIVRTAEWLGRRFQAIDTGGLIPDSADEIEHQVERQVSVALAEADAVVLVVDGHTGLAPLDLEIASRLRRKARSFLVAANKLDIKRGFDPSEFHTLGATAVIPISAEQGTGVDVLLDRILSFLPPLEPSGPRTPKPLSLAILGRPNVGKSSFLNALLGDERAIVTAIPGTTRDVVEETFQLKGRSYRLLDTAGIRRKTKVSRPVEYYSVTRAIDIIDRCDVALLVIDATEGPTNQDKKIANLVESRDKGLVIVANKVDLVPARLNRRVRDYVRAELAFVGYAPVAYTSALKAQGIVPAVEQAQQVYDAGARQLSNALLRAAVLEQLQAKPPKHSTRVIGLSQTGTRPPRFRLRLSEPGAAGPAYQRFVIAAIRSCFSFTGYPVRLRLTR